MSKAKSLFNCSTRYSWNVLESGVHSLGLAVFIRDTYIGDTKAYNGKISGLVLSTSLFGQTCCAPVQVAP